MQLNVCCNFKLVTPTSCYLFTMSVRIQLAGQELKCNEVDQHLQVVYGCTKLRREYAAMPHFLFGL